MTLQRIDWPIRKMVCRKVRPKDVIGRYGEMVRRKVRPKDVIGRYGKMVRRKVRPKGSYWTIRKDGPYEDSS